jgi:hypothetical protein
MWQQMMHQVVFVTLDHWTSKAKQSYSGMTVHYTYDNWIQTQYDLGCYLHEVMTTGTAIKEDYIKNLFKELRQ